MIRPVFFSIGFRPFFASGILFSALALFIWAAFWQPAMQSSISAAFNTFGGFLFWHPHELIMGFALAIIMGFLLTAARNWTGLETAPPVGLFILWVLWVIARLVMAFGGDLDFSLVLISQIIVPLLGATFIARPIIQKRMWRNLFAPGILFIFALLDSIMLYQIHHSTGASGPLLQACILLIIIMITMIGGRIIPLFTANKLGIKKANEPKPLFLAAIIPLILLVLVSLLPENTITQAISAICAAVLFIAHTLRLKLWFHKGLLKQPMLWSLWGFYAALPLGFLFLAAEPILQNWLEIGSVPLHIFAIGGICGLILSMVSRVSLGHTGRNIIHDKVIVSAFIILMLSFVLRTLVATVTGLSSPLITYSATLAGISFLLIFCRFIYVWLTPRPDKK